MITICQAGKRPASSPLFLAFDNKLENAYKLKIEPDQWLTKTGVGRQAGNAPHLPTVCSPCLCWMSATTQVGENTPSYYVGEGDSYPLSYDRQWGSGSLPIAPHSHKSILALDIGETTGWALSCPVSGITSGSEVFGQPLSDGKQAFGRFGTWLKQVNITVHGLEAVYFGQIEHFLTLGMARAYGSLLGQLTGFCEARRMSCQEVPLTQILAQLNLGRSATDHPEDWISGMQRRGFSPVDHHEATALAVLTWALDTQGA